MHPNLSGNGWGEPDARTKAVRELNRDLNFRQGVTHTIDRQRLGESLVKGAFTAPNPGELMSGTSYHDRESTVFYPCSREAAKAEFAEAGLQDMDGDGSIRR